VAGFLFSFCAAYLATVLGARMVSVRIGDNTGRVFEASPGGRASGTGTRTSGVVLNGYAGTREGS